MATDPEFEDLGPADKGFEDLGPAEPLHLEGGFGPQAMSLGGREPLFPRATTQMAELRRAPMKAEADAAEAADNPSILDQMKQMAGADVATVGKITSFLGKGIRQGVTATENVFPVIKPLTRPFENDQGEIQPLPLAETARKLTGGTDVAGSSMLEQGVLGGAAQGTAQLAEDLLTPENAALALGVAAIPAGLASRAVAALFGAQMTIGAVEQMPGLKAAAQSGDWTEFGRLAAIATGSGVLGVAGLKHSGMRFPDILGGAAQAADVLKGKIDARLPQQAAPADVYGPQDNPMRSVDEFIQAPQAPPPEPLKARVDAEKDAIERPGLESLTLEGNQPTVGAMDLESPLPGRGGLDSLELGGNRAARRRAARDAESLAKLTAAAEKAGTLNPPPAPQAQPPPRARRDLHAPMPLDPSTLETVEPAGEASFEAPGVNGEPLHPLLPPDRPIRDAVNEQFKGQDPQAIADQVRAMYGIEAPIQVEIGDDQTPSHTTLENGVVTVTLQPGAEPYQVVHEVAFEARKLTGNLMTEPIHDNNVIIGRFLQDVRLAGAKVHRSNGLPDRAFVGPNPLSEASGRTYDLDQPFPGGGDPVDAAVPVVRNVFDPHGLLDPENSALHGDLDQERQRAVDEAMRAVPADVREAAPETFHTAVQNWNANWLKQHGFDSVLWADEAGRHLTELPKAEPYEQGGSQAAEDGSPRPGAPEEARIAHDREIIDLGESRGLEMAAGLGPLDPRVLKKGLTPVFRNTILPVASHLLGMFSEGVRSFTESFRAPSLVDDRFLSAYMEKTGQRNETMARFHLNYDISKIRTLMDRLTRDQQIDFIDKYQRGVDVGDILLSEGFREQVLPWKEKYTTTFRAIAELIRKNEDASYKDVDAEMKRSGEQGLNYIDNHLANFWEKRLVKGPDGLPIVDKAGYDQRLARLVASHRPFEGSQGAMKARVYDSIKAGMDAGLVPLTTNPMVMMELRLSDNQKFLTARRVLRVSQENGSGGFAPVGTDRDFLAQPGHEDWVPLANQKAARQYFPTKNGEMGFGTFYFEPNLGRIINNYLAFDPVRASQIGRGLMFVKNFSTSIELGISAFHGSFTTIAQSGADFSTGVRNLAGGNVVDGLKQLGRAIIPGYSGVDAAFQGGKFIKYLADKEAFKKEFGLDNAFIKTIGGEAKMDEMIHRFFTAGGTVGSNQSFRSDTWGAVKDAHLNNDALGIMLRTIPAINQTIMRPLLETYVPRLKIAGWLKEVSAMSIESADALERGDISQAAIDRKAWDRQESRFGQVNPDNLAWPPMMRTALTFFLRSVTWQVGNIRTLSGAINEMAPALPTTQDFDSPLAAIKRIAGENGKAASLTPKGKSDLLFLAGIATNTAVLGAIVQKSSAGKWPWETDTPLQDFFFPRNGDLDSAGNPSRYNQPSYVRNYINMGRSAKALAEGRISDASDYIKGMASLPIMRAMEIWANKDYYQYQVYDPNANMLKAAAQIFYHQFKYPVPISVQSLMHTQSPEGQALGFLGWTLASPKLFYTEGQVAVNSILRRQSSGQPGRDPKLRESLDALARIRDAVNNNRAPDPADLQLAPSDAVDKAYTTHGMKPFAAQFSRIRKVEDLLSVWPHLNPDEKKVAYPLILNRIGNMRESAHSTKELQDIWASEQQIRDEMSAQPAQKSPA